MDLAQVDDQAEQVEVKRPEDQVEHLARRRLRRLLLARDRDPEGDPARGKTALMRDRRERRGALEELHPGPRELAEEAAQQWTGRFNPRPVGFAELLQLYKEAL